MKTPARSIRWHLAQVLLVCIVPVGLVGAVLLYLHWQAQESQRERTQVESARLLGTAVDNAIDSTVQRLSIFARLIAAGDEHDERIFEQAQQALAGNPDWINLLLWTAEGKGVFRLDQAHGQPMGPMRLPQLWGPALQERRTVVSDIFESPITRAKLVAIGVPVVRGERVTHVLIANLNLAWFDRLLTRQGLPETGGVAGIFDRNWKFLARSSDGDARRGTDPSQPLVEDMKRKPEGIGRYDSLNGIGVYTAWTSTRHGWWVAYATPAAPIEAAFWRHLALFGLLWLAAIGAGIFYSLRKARLVTGALVGLEKETAQLARGHQLGRLPPSGISEVDRALGALEQASEILAVALRERERALGTEREARAVAEDANRAKDEFLAMLGHELRNPLAAISNAVGIARSENRTGEQLEFATSVIARQSQHLKRLIDDLLDVGRVMTGKILLEREPLDLAASVRHVVTALETGGRLVERSIEIHAQPVWIAGDHTRIEQIIANLLTNAGTHTRAGGRIRIEVCREDRQAVVRVRDDGAGIAPEHLPRLFELFFQGDSTVDRTSGGLGIGLTLVQRLSALHGGSVVAESAGRGHGATFTVRFPAIPAPQARAEERSLANPASTQRVLLVEDNADERESLRIALELRGHEVVQAADGASALAEIRRDAPPVAIIDIGLPGMDGYRLAQAIRTEASAAIRLVALTGYGTAADAKRAREAGFDSHLAKPVDVVDLVKVIGQGGRKRPH